MTPDERQDDQILAAVAGLRTYDVPQRYARRLRRRCHALLQTQPPPDTSAALVFQRIIGPALGGAWCLAYLVEIVRRAAAVYLGTQ